MKKIICEEKKKKGTKTPHRSWMNTPAPWSSVSSICLCINQTRGPGSLRLIPGAWQGTKTGCQVCWGRLNKQSAFCKVVSQNLCSAEHFVFREVTFPGTKASSRRLSSLLKRGSNVRPGNRCYQLHGAKPGFKINSQPILLEMVLGKQWGDYMSSGPCDRPLLWL